MRLLLIALIVIEATSIVRSEYSSKSASLGAKSIVKSPSVDKLLSIVNRIDSPPSFDQRPIKRIAAYQTVRIHKFSAGDAIKPRQMRSDDFVRKSWYNPSSASSRHNSRSIVKPIYTRLTDDAIRNALSIADFLPSIELPDDSSQMAADPIVVPRNLIATRPMLPRKMSKMNRRSPVSNIAANVAFIDPNQYLDDEHGAAPFPSSTPRPLPNLRSTKAPAPCKKSQPHVQQDHGRKTTKSRRPVNIRKITSLYQPAVARQTRTVVTETKFVPDHTSILSTTSFRPARKTTIIDDRHLK